jgi:mono/diheme cytochrome c family protein
MSFSKLFCLHALLAVAATFILGQEAPVTREPSARAGSGKPSNDTAIAGSKQDPAAVARGAKVFAASCAGCHGATAKGGPGAPDLVRSLLVLDDEKGLLIAPVIREGRPDKGMPKLGLSEQQIADVVAWLHVQTYAAGHRGTYVFQNVVTGNAKEGETYFNTTGTCNTCHSVKGDLAGIGSKYDAFSLQMRWLNPRGNRRGRSRGAAANSSPKAQPTVTVTLASGQSFSGTLDRLDDFTVSLRDSNGEFHSFARDGENPPRVEVHDPLQAHNELLGKYTDADIHNITAYLVTLK